MTLAERIRSEIETRIHTGEWSPGTRIPFEHELVRQYDCSRATVSKALEGLSRAGLIERRRKAGSFVAQPQIQSAVLEVPDIPKLVAARGQPYRWELLTRREAEPADLYGTSEIEAPALLVEGIHFADNEPLAFERRLLSLDAVPDVADEGFTDVPPGTWLLQHTPWTTARHRIRAIEADADLARALAIRPGAACLEVQRRTWRASSAVTHVVVSFRGDRFDMVAEFKPG